MPSGAILQRSGFTIDRKKESLRKVLPSLKEEQLIKLAVILQFSDVADYTQDELKRVAELRIPLLDANVNTRLRFEFSRTSRAYSSGSSRIHRYLLEHEELDERVLDSLYAQSISFTPRNLILASL